MAGQMASHSAFAMRCYFALGKDETTFSLLSGYQYLAYTKTQDISREVSLRAIILCGSPSKKIFVRIDSVLPVRGKLIEGGALSS
jgi:hypothetical protein